MSDSIQSGKWVLQKELWIPLHELMLKAYFWEASRHDSNSGEVDAICRIYVLLAKNLISIRVSHPFQFSLFICKFFFIDSSNKKIPKQLISINLF